MRADVRRNRAALLDAAVELFVEHGIEAPLDAIARRANLGVATLYRHFPDREALVKAVAMRAFTVVAELAERLVDPADGAVAAGDGGGAPGAHSRLEAFTTAVAGLRLGAFMPSLLPVLAVLDPEEEVERALAAMLRSVDDFVATCQRDGELRSDVTGEDLLLVLAVTSRPLEGLPKAFTSQVAPRLVALAVEGLRPRADARRLPEAPSPPKP